MPPAAIKITRRMTSRWKPKASAASTYFSVIIQFRMHNSSRIILASSGSLVYGIFGIVALVHSLLKVAGIRQLFLDRKQKDTKAGGEKRFVFAPPTLFLGTYWTVPFLCSIR